MPKGPLNLRPAWLKWALRCGLAVIALVVLLLLLLKFTPLSAEIALRVFLSPPHITDAKQYRLHPFPHEKLTVTAPDGAPLVVVHARPPGPAKGTVAILHGHVNTKDSQLALAEKLLKDGWEVVLPDSRAHGESGGKWCTFGILEGEDLRAVLAETDRRFQLAQPINLVASSLGASSALHFTAAHPKEIASMVLISPFSTLRDAAEPRLKPHAWIVKSSDVEKRVEKILGVPIDKISPVEKARAVTAAALVIHGANDTDAPSWQGKAVFDALGSRSKEWLPVEGAAHSNLFSGSAPWTAGLVDRIIGFLNQHGTQARTD